MHNRMYAALTITAALALSAAGPAAASADASPRLEKLEALGRAGTLSPGRRDELLRPLAPDAPYGSFRLLPTLANVERLGPRALLLHAIAVNLDSTDERISFVDLLVRERPRSGRIIVRLVLG